MVASSVNGKAAGAITVALVQLSPAKKVAALVVACEFKNYLLRDNTTSRAKNIVRGRTHNHAFFVRIFIKSLHKFFESGRRG